MLGQLHSPTLSDLKQKKKKQVSNARVVYKIPTTLQGILTNYRKIAHNLNPIEFGEGSSNPCNNCALCGKHGKKPSRPMVTSSKFIVTKNNKRISFSQNLYCSNYGIYAVQCLKCGKIYGEQTKNKFSI